MIILKVYKVKISTNIHVINFALSYMKKNVKGIKAAFNRDVGKNIMFIKIQ